MIVPLRPALDTDREPVVDLAVRAWAPVFASLQQVLRGSGVFELQYPDGWVVAQRAAVGALFDPGPDTPTVWVADRGDGPVGFVAVVLHEADRMGEIHMVAVDPDHHRRGIGAALTAFAVERMVEAGMTSAMVETGGDPGHAPARATYTAAGFTLLPVSRYFRAL